MLAFGAAALAHVLVIFLLVWRLGAMPPLAETPTMNVQLTRALPKPRPEKAPRTVAPRAGPGSRSKSPLHLTPQPDEQALVGVPAPLAAGPEGDVRRALRGILGCQHADLARLSPEERQRCLDRMASAGSNERGAPIARLNLDIRGTYAKDPEPYLNRRPKHGCKPRAAGDVSPAGKEGAEAGIDCAWSF
jgi:hypothetical protein